MLIIDQLQKDDRRLRALAIVVLLGMAVLGVGAWRLQVLSAQRYSQSEAAQSIRLVRVPAVRGKILDRNGIPLAENRPSFDVNLYLEELRASFVREYTNRVVPDYRAMNPGVRTTLDVRRALQEKARLQVYTNTVTAVANSLGVVLPVSGDRFLRHYTRDLALPLPVMENLDPPQMALFFERCLGVPGVDLEVQAIRSYPRGALASHVLGHLRRSDESDNDPDPLVFRYRLRDYEGVAGLEGRYDAELRGRAGVKALRVNSQGYRHEESIYQPTEPGQTLKLTLDVDIQHTAERSLSQVAGDRTRGAVVVMDVHSGDVIALVSAPDFDPNLFLGGISQAEMSRLNDEKLRPQMNRAVSGAYPPGSVFKIVVALAGLEQGVIKPHVRHHYLGYWQSAGRSIDDTAPPGDYDFKRAFKRSSNAYFIDHGVQLGRARMVSMAQRLGFGERTGIEVGAEAPGFLPDEEYLGKLRIARDPWTEGDTEHLSIGQGALTTTPLQVAVMVSAIANGGKILQPRIVQHVEDSEGRIVRANPPRILADAGVDPRHLETVRAAMLADVEEDEGTGREAAVPGFRVSGKTGTAEVKRGRVLIDKITWFVAFAPYESPRYAVVVVVESGGSGGKTSAPVAQDIFAAIHRREQGAGRLPEAARSVVQAGEAGSERALRGGGG